MTPGSGVDTPRILALVLPAGAWDPSTPESVHALSYTLPPPGTPPEHPRNTMLYDLHWVDVRAGWTLEYMAGDSFGISLPRVGSKLGEKGDRSVAMPCRRTAPRPPRRWPLSAKYIG